MINIKILPELKRLIPPLTPEEYSQLEANCIQDGVRDPIVLWKRLIDKEHPDFSFKCYDYEDDEDVCLENISIADGCFECNKCNAGVAGWEYEHILVDGHNRLEISEKHGLKYNVSYLDLYDLDDVKLWMIDNQKGRRNLSDFVKFELSDVKADILRKKGLKYKKRAAELTNNKLHGTLLSIIDKSVQETPPHNTQKEQASDLGWSTGKVAMATVVKNNADEETKEKLRRNEVTINSVYQDIKRNEVIQSKLAKPKNTDEPIPLPRVTPMDENLFIYSSERSERFGDKVFSLFDSKYNTVSTLSRFFHKETMLEFSIREYANVQTFPTSFRFVGSVTSIKKQIGNAVAPYMGQYITKELTGKTIGDLFAGCGGFTCGAHQNGLGSKWAIEWDKDAANSYKMNFPETKVFNENIKALNPKDFEPVDIIIGGPPCQGFSGANPDNRSVPAKDRFADDPRNELYKEFLRFVDALKPKEFIMENVPEIQDVKDEIILDFEGIGYSVKTKLIIGNEIGMKQNRKRFFFIGKKI